MHKCIDCERPATHKLRAGGGVIIYVCDEHSKRYVGCKEIMPFKIRIVKNKFKLALALLLITSNLVWAILYYLT